MPHYFDQQHNYDKLTAKRLAKCVICDAVLDGSSELDICENCQRECERLKKILSYLKIDIQPEARTDALTEKHIVHNQPITSVPVESASPKKLHTGTTVLGSDDGFYSGVSNVTNDLSIKKKQAFVVRTKNSERKMLNKQVFTIGKSSKEADLLILDNKTISRKHAQVINKDKSYFIMDVNSTNGTFLNGTKLNPFCEAPISPGDKFYLSDEEFEFMVEG